MEISKDSLKPYLVFDTPIRYDQSIILYPVKMENILDFRLYEKALTLRKDSIFKEKNILKMEYLDFLKYANGNDELAEQYDMKSLPYLYSLLIRLFSIVCGSESKIMIDEPTLGIYINDELITNEIFNDLRRIIIIQNDIDFDVDEFISLDVIKSLEKAQKFEQEKNKDDADIEDYIDSVAIAMQLSNERIKELSIRKFWRYVKRINKHEEYSAYSNAKLSGWVKFKTPLPHWMTSIDVIDKYENLKADESELRSKIG